MATDNRQTESSSRSQSEVNTRNRENRQMVTSSPSREFARYEPTSIGSSNPFGIMRRLLDDMDHLFDGFGGIAGLESPRGRYGTLGMSRWMPQIDVREGDGKILIHADLPGMKESDVNVELRDNALVISGERVDEHREEQDQGVWRSERSYGSFQRTIPLPRGVEAERCKAQFNNGVLEIEVAIPEGSAAKRIPIGGVGTTPTKRN